MDDTSWVEFHCHYAVSYVVILRPLHIGHFIVSISRLPQNTGLCFCHFLAYQKNPYQVLCFK